MARLPLIQNYTPDAVFAWRGGHAVSARQFLGDVTALAARLPDRQYVLNLCDDRYQFTVGFAAALVRGQVSLLPPNHTADFVARVRADHPGLYCLTDSNDGHPMPETVRCGPGVSGGGVPRAAVPLIGADTVALIAFTSGSTGQPLPHSKRWGSLVRGARAEADLLGLHRYPGMSMVGTVPPQHMYGLESTVLLALQAGVIMHAGRPFYPADVAAALASLPRPRMLVTTPMHLRLSLEDAGPVPEADLLVSATAQLFAETAAAAEARFKAPLHEIYGCTESGQIATRRPLHSREWFTFPGVQMRRGCEGIYASGGHSETEVMLNDDIELIAADRFLLRGRLSDLVNVAGKRTSLESLNFHLNSIKGVRDGIFIVPEQGGGAVVRLAALVVAPELSAEELTQALRQRIDHAFLPRPIRFVTEVPRNSTGKVPRAAISSLMQVVGMNPEMP